jgi:hypothetical protein
MSQIINIHDARLRTVQVGVKAITISDKQVTQSVFRQLWDEPLITEDGTLAGLGWGIVNYHPDKCVADEPHWHVVWQKGDELRRAVVFQTPSFGELYCRELDDYINARIRDVVLGKDSNIPILKDGAWKTVFNYSDKIAAIAIPSDWANHYLSEYTRYQEKQEIYDCELLDLPSQEECWQAVKAALASELARRERWRKTTTEIASLPQLFIAV